MNKQILRKPENKSQDAAYIAEAIRIIGCMETPLDQWTTFKVLRALDAPYDQIFSMARAYLLGEMEGKRQERSRRKY